MIDVSIHILKHEAETGVHLRHHTAEVLIRRVIPRHPLVKVAAVLCDCECSHIDVCLRANYAYCTRDLLLYLRYVCGRSQR
jgi:hypothetical protein